MKNNILGCGWEVLCGRGFSTTTSTVNKATPLFSKPALRIPDGEYTSSGACFMCTKKWLS